MHLHANGEEVGNMQMPTGIDLDGQEQRVVLGGGDDRHFRECTIDEVRIWSSLRPFPASRSDSSSSNEEGCPLSDGDLVAHFTFDDMTEGVRLRDCSGMRGDAIRVGRTLQTASAFVAGAPATAPCKACMEQSMWPALQKGTLIITYLGVSCSGARSQFTKGSLYQLEAYMGAMWLDANRLGISLLIITDCLPKSVATKYTTPAVTFQTVESLGWIPPRSCRGNVEHDAVLKRFLVFDHLFASGRFDAYSYVVHMDLRDARIVKVPNWNRNKEIWFQNVRTSGGVCGGFQAGETNAMGRLMAAMARGAETMRCKINDQTLLQNLHRDRKYGTSAEKTGTGGEVINNQHMRVFNMNTFFVHGDWWMSKNKIRDAYASSAYPHGIPYLD